MITKLVVIALYVAPPLWALFLSVSIAWRVWQAEYVTLGWLNPFAVSEKYAAEQLEGKSRAADALYQDAMIVGRLRGEPTIDMNARRVVFPQIIRSDALDPDRIFLFRRWELRLVPPAPQLSQITIGGTMVIGDPTKVSLPEMQGRVLTNAHAEIVGSAF